ERIERTTRGAYGPVHVLRRPHGNDACGGLSCRVDDREFLCLEGIDPATVDIELAVVVCHRGSRCISGLDAWTVLRRRAAPGAPGELPGTRVILLPAYRARTPLKPGRCDMLFPTTLVGSYPQPDWLIDREKLAGRFPPRVRMRELWRIPEPFLAQAQEDATVLAIKAQEDAGLDIVTDGEIRRESYSNRFATALSGVDLDNPGTALDRSGHPNPVPRVVGKVRRLRPVQVSDLNFLKRHTRRTIKITVPGPFTMSQQAQNDFYPSEAELALDYAAAVNEEIRDLFAAGADIVQLDEPYMQARPEKARQFGLQALNRALEGVTGRTAVHICFGYAAIIH